MAVVGIAARSLDQKGARAQRPGADRRGAARRRSAAGRRHRASGSPPPPPPRLRRRARRRATAGRGAGRALGRALVLTSVWAETGPPADRRVGVPAGDGGRRACSARWPFRAWPWRRWRPWRPWSPTSPRRGCSRRPAWRCAPAPPLVTESARVVDLAAVAHLAGAGAAPGRRGRLLRAPSPCGCGRGSRDAARSRARLRPGAVTARGGAGGVDCGGTGQPRALRPRPFLELTAFDVGQGDAIAVRFPNGTTMLVDAGGRASGSRFDVGARVVGPALRARGIRRLDYLVVTHADADHIGGAVSLVGEFRPARGVDRRPGGRRRRDGGPAPRPPTRLAPRGARCSAATAWRSAPSRSRVLHPPPPDWERQRVRNDDSVVLAVRHRRRARPADRRHQHRGRSGGGGGRAQRRRCRSATAHAAEGRAPRQRRVDLGGVPARHRPGAGRRQRRRRRPVRAPGARRPSIVWPRPTSTCGAPIATAP